jgi:hypothetical protein
MTPPIGFRTDNSSKTGGTVIPIMPTAAIGGEGATLVAPSQFADYAYRIAALTAGIALLTTFI